ncbi:hypothetical protein HELRODRAFT_191375 [Helobdella robusta]|uniref:DM1 domain-containing protein n=1 Tax=Helobdella robusta TaxID=6412 RepID=T1FSX7_HELRO|nr:hypothetical protein HELRODRAFT_191375 [Helobdella robusta]ESO05754.1 hypothetical protein HELRODRAFT_191375 [Helobdella robusta]
MIEVIDFYWKRENDKILIIDDIRCESSDSEDVICNRLYEYFSKHVLVYDLTVFKSSYSVNQTESYSSMEGNFYNYYAMLKLYSKEGATKILQRNNYFDGQLLKVKHSNKQDVSLPKIFYYKKCFELANYLLGFNGWSLGLSKFEEVPDSQKEDDAVTHLNILCTVKLKFTPVGKECCGKGTASDTYASNVHEEKSVAFNKCKKRAYANAVEDAFSKVLLVVLDNGKVHIEIIERSPVISDEEKCSYLHVNSVDVYVDDNSDAAVDAGDDGAHDITDISVSELAMKSQNAFVQI